MPVPANEESLPLVDAIQRATGRRVNLSTALRWCQSHNRYGNRLQSWLIGGRRVTSVESVHRYNESNTAAADRHQCAAAAPTCRQRERSAAKAVADLDRELGNG